jgi:hypothetical protein
MIDEFMGKMEENVALFINLEHVIINKRKNLTIAMSDVKRFISLAFSRSKV